MIVCAAKETAWSVLTRDGDCMSSEQSDVGDQHEADSSVTSKSTTSAATTATTAAMATSATTVVTMTTPTAATTTKAQTPTPTSAVMTITIGYMQFQMGQAPVYVNRNTQAVTVAVIEGLLLGTILAVVLFKFYKKSKLITAGQYPSNDIFQPNYTDNSVYNDNGVLGNGNGRESSARPQIPSYRTQVTQPAVRLDSLQPPPQQEIITPTLMPISTTSTTVTPAPLNNWPDQEKQRHPVKNIMDSDF
uniref:CD99 antigen-like protein 2 n=1 Tax=Angiostrongylus cantonensis TaxID=6313 RepID=A0A0K0DCX5_ANGCA